MFKNAELFDKGNLHSLPLSLQQMILFNYYIKYLKYYENREEKNTIDIIDKICNYYNVEKKDEKGIDKAFEKLTSFLKEIQEIQSQRIEELKIKTEKKDLKIDEDEEKGVDCFYYLSNAPKWIINQSLKILIKYIYSLENQQKKDEYNRFVDMCEAVKGANPYIDVNEVNNNRKEFFRTRFGSIIKEEDRSPRFLNQDEIRKIIPSLIPEE